MLKLVVVESEFLIKEIFVFVKKKILFLIIFLDHLSFIAFVNFYSLVFQISYDFLSFADIVAETQKLYEVFELIFYWENLLSECLDYFDEDVVFLSEEYEE